MFDYLSGTIRSRVATGLTLDVGGVGYALLTPLGSAFPSEGCQVQVWVHFVVREDAQLLYGFDRCEHRDLFRELLKVKGVGPAMALALLSGLSPADLMSAILAEDLASLTRIKGVGKKTAEQILLDLRDKAAAIGSALGLQPSARQGGSHAEAQEPGHQDAISALVSLGFSAKDAQSRVARVADSVPQDDVEALVQAAFRS